MKSILDGRLELKKEIDKIAEVAGYLWQNGWAERNGGNITVNITDLVDDEIRQMPAISDTIQIGTALPALKGGYFFCKGTGKRMRDLARWPMDNGSIIRILDDCASYVIIADNAVTGHIPVLMLTARTLEEQRAQGYAHGADAYLTKPFSTPVLLARIQNLLQQREMLRRIFAQSVSTAQPTTEDTKAQHRREYSF